MKKNGIFPLIPLFNSLDKTYNGLLFKKHFSETIDIDDKTLKDIIRNMSFPVSPFQFDVIEPEILGRIYEKFLGSKIRLTANHQAKVEEKIEVRKAGGVYYTPEYIVEYIVKNTVGKKIEGLTPTEIANIKIVDPACGSGSFLLGAYSYLLDYHKNFYSSASAPERNKYKADFYISKLGELTVTLEKRADILRNNIFGVDIDKEATEVAIMSLYLKMLDDGFDKGERDLFFVKGHVLPDMSANIKCGNSLIGTDYFEGRLDYDIEEMKEIKPFDWEREFPKIFMPSTPALLPEGEGSNSSVENAAGGGSKPKTEGGGFDCVIGNPPYRMIQPNNTSSNILSYIKNNYVAVDFKIDLFHLFIQKGILIQKRNNGLLGVIIPASLLNNVYVEKLRKWILEKCCIKKISVCNEKIFNAEVFTAVIILQNDFQGLNIQDNEIITTTELSKNYSDNILNNSNISLQKDFYNLSGYIWNVLINKDNISILKKITNNSKRLNDVAILNRGLITGDKEKYFSTEKISDKYISIIAGADVFRYYSNAPSEYVLFERPKTSGGCWDEAVHKANYKIVIRQIGVKPQATFIEEIIAVTGNIFTVRTENYSDHKYILAIINSKMNEYFWRIMFCDFKTTFPQVTIESLNQIPIKFDNHIHDNLVSLVDQMLKTQKDYQSVKSEADKAVYEQKISMLDEQIDSLVYKLYGLSDEEIKIVEGK